MNSHKAIGGALVLFVMLVVGLVVVDCCTMKGFNTTTGKVLARSHTSALTSTGTGISTSGKPVVVTTSSPEVWEVIVLIGHEPKAFSCKREIWADCEPGRTVTIWHYQGAVGIIQRSEITAVHNHHP